MNDQKAAAPRLIEPTSGPSRRERLSGLRDYGVAAAFGAMVL